MRATMTMTCVFFDAAPVVLFALLKQWLGPREILRLDSALCNRTLRGDFTALLSSLHFDAQPTKSSAICKYFEWMIQRRVPVRSIRVQNATKTAPGCPTKKPMSMFIRIKKLFRPKQIFMCKWLRTVLLQSSTTLLELSITTGARKYAFTNEVFCAIGLCSQLRSLHLAQYPNIQSEMSTALTPIMLGCQVLEELVLHGCLFTEQDAEQISNSLRTFDFIAQRPPFLTASTLPRLVTRCTKLTKLRVWDRIWTSAAAVQLFHMDMYNLLAQHVPSLQYLQVITTSSYCTGLVNMLHTCKHLHTVKFHACSNLSQSMFTVLVQHATITHLLLDDNATLTGQVSTTQEPSNEALATNQVLQCLRLRCFLALTNEGLAALLQRCPALVSLQVGWLQRLSVAAVNAIVQHCPRMTRVEFCQCMLLTSEIVQARLQALESGISMTCTTTPSTF